MSVISKMKDTSNFLSPFDPFFEPFSARAPSVKWSGAGAAQGLAAAEVGALAVAAVVGCGAGAAFAATACCPSTPGFMASSWA